MCGIQTSMGLSLLVLMLAAGTAPAGAPIRQSRAPDRVEALLNSGPGPAVADSEAPGQAGDDRQDPAELRLTRALNDEILQRNLLAENQERVDRAEFEAARRRYEDEVTRATGARLAYEAALREAEAAQRQWAADHARWEADVRACTAGDRTRCAAPPRSEP